MIQVVVEIHMIGRTQIRRVRGQQNRVIDLDLRVVERGFQRGIESRRAFRLGRDRRAFVLDAQRAKLQNLDRLRAQIGDSQHRHQRDQQQRHCRADPPAA